MPASRVPEHRPRRRLGRSFRFCMVVIEVASGLVAVTLLTAAPALAVPARPHTTASYYVTHLSADGTTATSTNTSMYSIGCSEGTYDRENSAASRETVLDFGQQSSSGTSAEIFDTNGTYASSSKIQVMAEQFAYGYWTCTESDVSAQLYLDIGTSTHGYTGSTQGTAWGNIVNAINSKLGTLGVSSQVLAQGANDMELAWASYSSTLAWGQAYSNTTHGLYLDYGDAEGCPSNGVKYNDHGCISGWTQYRVFEIAYGLPDAIVSPEIYCEPSSPLNANQWAAISWYGANYQSSEISYIAPWDEGSLDSSTDSYVDAWNQLWNSSNAFGVATTPQYSITVTYEDSRSTSGGLCD